MAEGRRATVERVEEVDGGLDVTVTVTWVTGIGGRRVARGVTGGLRVIASNDVRREFLLGSSGGNSTNTMPLPLAGPRAARQTINLRYRLGTSAFSAEGVDPEWFDDAALLLYSNEYVGTFRSTLLSDLSELGEPTRSAAPMVRTAAQTLPASLEDAVRRVTGRAR